jgi:hypothetical protein
MTTALNVRPAPARPDVAPLAVVAIVFAAAIAVVTLITAGISFGALAIAFPLAVPVAEYFDVPFSLADGAIAAQVAGFWGAFAALAVASFGLAAVVAVAALRAVSRTTSS